MSCYIFSLVGEVFADIASIWHRLSNIDLKDCPVFADYAAVILIHPALHYRDLY